MAGADPGQGAEDRAAQADLHRPARADLHPRRGALGLSETQARLRAAAERALLEATRATGVVRLCARCGSSSHGQPRLLGSSLSVSISYARAHGRTPISVDLAVVAWGTGPIGVDVEEFGVHPGTRRLEPGDLEEWTRAEALAKATGLGLVAPALPDLPLTRLEVPQRYVAHAAGAIAGWRLVTGSGV